MARHFLRLKLTLLGSGFRRSWQQAVGLLLGTITALPLGAGIGGLVALAGRRGADPLALLGIGCTLLVAGWTVIPLVAFGVDQTLDPARLRLLPLTRRQLLVGLSVAGSVGLAPLATLLVLAGVVAGFAPAGPEAVVVLLAALGQFALCLFASRAVTTALAARLSSPRARDATAFAGALLVIAVALGAQLPSLVVLAPGSPGDLVDAVAAWGTRLSLLPPAWSARAVAAAAGGRLLDSLAWLGGEAALVAGAGWWWMAALDRSAGQSSGGRTRADEHGLYPRLAGFLPRNRLGATAARELRYAWRVPRLRLQWVLSAVFAAGSVAAGALVAALDRPEWVLAALVPVGLQAFGNLNVLGVDRGAVWLLVASEAGWRDLAGKNLSAALLALPMTAVAGLALAALTGGWVLYPVVLLAAVVLLAVSCGVGDLASVLAPQPLPDSPLNTFGAGTGLGVAAALIQSAALVVIAVLLAPVAVGVGVAVFLRPALLPVVLAVAAAYGLAVGAAGIWLAGLRLQRRGPELLATLTSRGA